MVAAVRRGQPLRAVATQFGVGVATVAHWVERAQGQRLDRIDFADRSPFAASSVAAGSQAKVTGTLVCNRLTVYALSKTRACYFPYTVSKDNGKPCADPGVRVVPPMVGVLFYLELVVLLGLVSFAVWRIRARK